MSLSAIAEPRRVSLSLGDVAIALAVVLPLAAVIAPYRAVHLPQMFILALALLGGALCVKLAIEDVEQLMFLFLLYIPFQKVLPGDFGGMAKAVNFTNALMLLLFFGWLVSRRQETRDPAAHRWTMLDLAVIVFLGIVTIAITTEALRQSTDMRYEMLSDLKRWLTPFAVYFLVTAIGRSRKMVNRMLLAVVVTTAVIGLLGVKQFWMDMGGGTRHNLSEIRIKVTSGPSNLGALFAYYLPYMVALWFANFWRLSYWAFVFPIVWCMDALRTTFSRGAAVAFLAGVAAILWKRSKIAFTLVAIVITFLVQSGDVTLPYSIFGRMSETYRSDRPGDSVTDKLDASARTRVIIWSGGLQMVKDHPFFGVGYGQFPSLIGDYAPEVAGMDPHNNYLKIAAEMGLPALVSFVALIMLCFWRGYRIYGKVTDPFTKALLLGYIGSVVGLFVANIFGSRLDSEEITTQFWAMTGGVALLGRLPEDAAVEGEDGDEPEREE